MSATAPVPADTDSTRSAHFRELLGRGSSVVGGVFAALVVFTIGASQHSVPLMVGGPLAVVLVITVSCWFKADRQAEDEFFKRYADAHSMSHSASFQPYELTPLLAAGDKRECRHWMEKDGAALGWYTYGVRRENGDKESWKMFDFTVAMLDVGELGMRRFQGIYLRRRRGLFDHLSDDSNWLEGHHLKRVELESTAFGEKYELWTEQEQDEIVLRQLFAPTFVVWLADHPLAPGFELRAGTLVTFLPGQCGEAAKLDWLLLAGREIAKRIQLELTQSAQAGSL